jgi:transcriptional regulator with XRE-family HTH domain
MKKKKDNENRLKIGNNIRKWRNIKDVKQKDLAAALRLSEAAISNMENDMTDLTLSQLEDISTTLDIPVEHLFSDPQENFLAASGSFNPGFSKTQLLVDKELVNAMFSSLQKKDEQLQAMMKNVLNTMSSLIQDEKKFA